MAVNILSMGLYYTMVGGQKIYKCEVYLNLRDCRLTNPNFIIPAPPAPPAPPGAVEVYKIQVDDVPGYNVDILQTLVFDWRAPGQPQIPPTLTLQVQVVHSTNPNGPAITTKSKDYAQASASGGGGGGDERDHVLKRAMAMLNILNLSAADKAEFKSDI